MYSWQKSQCMWVYEKVRKKGKYFGEAVYKIHIQFSSVQFSSSVVFDSLWPHELQHTSVLAWRIQGTEEPGGLPSLGLHRVRHDWSSLAAAPAAAAAAGLPVHHQFSEFTQTHIHWVGDAIQPCHPLLSPSTPAPNPSQHQCLFQWVNSLHEVAKVLQFQL